MGPAPLPSDPAPPRHLAAACRANPEPVYLSTGHFAPPHTRAVWHLVFVGAARHEYDHAKGYGAEHQLYVEPVCVICHHRREESRRGLAA